MKKVLIISNVLKDKKRQITDRIVHILQEHGMLCGVNAVGEDDGKGERRRGTDIRAVDRDTDLVIIVGGDGTLMQAARDLAGTDIPMIGVNLGNLGYLAEIEQDNIEEMIEMIVQEKYKIESRLMLEGEVWRNDVCIQKDIALNDIVCARAGQLSVIDFKVYVNNEFLNAYRADGIIIATPTGSTAYNLSAGGPVLEPGADIIVVTPICTHTLGARSIVLSATSDILLEICAKEHYESNSSSVYFDGNVSYALAAGDQIKIRRSFLQTKIMKLNSMSFVQVLHKKM